MKAWERITPNKTLIISMKIIVPHFDSIVCYRCSTVVTINPFPFQRHAMKKCKVTHQTKMKSVYKHDIYKG